MATLSLVRTFARKFKSKIADAEKPDVYREYEFTVKFNTYSNTKEKREELAKLQEDNGIAGFLKEVVNTAECHNADLNFDDGAGNTVPVKDFVCFDLVVQQDALIEFWAGINKGVEEKNLKKSRSR